MILRLNISNLDTGTGTIRGSLSIRVDPGFPVKFRGSVAVFFKGSFGFSLGLPA